MILRTLKYYVVISMACGITALLLSGCANQQTARDQRAELLPLGLYKVVARECSYPPGVPEDCSQTQYLELVTGVFYGIGEGEIALVAWLAENPSLEHGYTARDLKGGKFVNAQKFVIEDDAIGKAWLVTRNGTITDYFFVRHARQTPHGEMAGKTHLTLSRTPRTTETDRLMPYPPKEE